MKELTEFRSKPSFKTFKYTKSEFPLFKESDLRSSHFATVFHSFL